MSGTTRNTRDFKTPLVTFLCLTGAAIGSYLLYADYNSQGDAGAGAPMGQIERRESKVRRKASTSYVWNQARKSEQVYLHDSIQTGPGSAVAIKFHEGSTLEIGENSLLVIDDLTNIALSFKSGSVIVRGADGKDSKITLGADGKTKIEQLQVRMTEPPALARYFVAGDAEKKISFQWNVLGKSSFPENASLEISPDHTFNSDKKRAIPVSSKNSAQASLPPGHYYWRIVGGGRALTESSQFKVVSVNPLKPTYPSSGDQVASFGNESPVQFRWSGNTDNDGAGQGVIEVARDADFKNIVSQTEVSPSAGVATIKQIPQGSYYWRMKSKVADVDLVSRAQKFEVEKPKKIEIEINSPLQASALELKPEVRLTWSAPASDLSYQLKIQSSDGKEILSESSDLPYYTWKTPETGAYKWRISAYDSSKQQVGESVWSSFSIFEGKPVALLEPKKGESIRYWDDPAQFKFKWSSDDAVDDKKFTYAFEIANDADFKTNLKTKSLSKNAISSEDLALKPGNYFWRVKVVDPSGMAVKTSAFQAFNYDFYPVLAAPKMVSPPVGGHYSLMEDDFSPSASWTEIDGAKSYDVSILRVSPPSGRNPASSAEVVVEHEKISDTKIDLKKLPPGNYKIRVRAIDRIDRLGDAEQARTFTIDYGKTLAPPEVISREVQ